MTDAEVWNQFVQFQKVQERKYAVKVYRLLRTQAARAAAYVRQYGPELALVNMVTFVPPDEIAGLLRQLYREVGVRWANVEYGNIQQYTKSWIQPVVVKAFGFNAEWEAILNLFFAAFGGEKIVSIDDTTRQWLIRKIEEGRAAGFGPEQIARSMVNDRDVPLARARVISRTETVAAANFGGLTAARKTGLRMIKRWVNAHDSRVRETHRDQSEGGVGGEVRQLEEPFSNGLMTPGDPQGSAKEVIQCRCIASMRPVRDASGMPIRA